MRSRASAFTSDRRAGIEGVRVHDLRHSYASGALLVGEGLTMIGKLLGHNKMEPAARYAHLANVTLSESAERVASAIQRRLRAIG